MILVHLNKMQQVRAQLPSLHLNIYGYMNLSTFYMLHCKFHYLFTLEFNILVANGFYVHQIHFDGESSDTILTNTSGAAVGIDFHYEEDPQIVL